jgi:hypothetical protein
MAEYYVQYCEIADVAIVSMLKCHEIQIDRTYRIHIRVAALSCRGFRVDPRSPTQGQLSGKRAFDEPVLRSLAMPSNRSHTMLGQGSAFEFIRDAKDSRNKWTRRHRENDTSNNLLSLVPSVNLLILQMRESNNAMEQALTDTKRNVE